MEIQSGYAAAGVAVHDQATRPSSAAGETGLPAHGLTGDAGGSHSRLGWIAPLLCSVALAALFNPRLILSSAIPAGYDLAGHIYPLWLATRNLLASGHLHAWSNGWLLGFPLYYFYFPLPAFLTAGLSPLLGFAPAAKVVTVLGTVGYPFAVYLLLRQLKLRDSVALPAVVVSCGFLFMRYFDLGGNIPSTLVGEYCYSLSLTLSLAYLAAVLRAAERPGDLPAMAVAAVLLAATALAHVITTLVIVLAVAPLLLRRRSRMAVAGSWALGFLLAAFWAVPFVARAGVTWSPFQQFDPELHRILTHDALLVVPVALVGMWLMRRTRGAASLAWMGAVALLLALVPQGAIYRPRFLPYWYLMLFLYAGLAVGALVETALRRRSALRALAALALAVTPLLGVGRAPFLRDWAAWDYSGFEEKPAWRDASAALSALRRQPPGRVHWEDDAGTFALVGSRNAFTLLPYWAPGYDALGGLWVQSSLTGSTAAAIDKQIAAAAASPNGGAAWQRIIDELGSLGVRYFFTLRPASARQVAALAGVRLLTVAGPFTLFQIPAAPLVQLPAGLPPATDVRVSDGEIRFHTSAIGVPHRIVVSYFPNWTAEGAAGPVRLGTFMGVVPTQGDVRLRFRSTGVEYLGLTLTGLGLLVLAGLLVAWLRGHFGAAQQPETEPRAAATGAGA